jgi:GTP cyclohydrolase I
MHSSTDSSPNHSLLVAKKLSQKSKKFNGEVAEKVEKMADLFREILQLVNPVASEEIIDRTPIRFSEALVEFTQGYHESLDDLLGEAIFENDGFNDLVVIKNIQFSSLCEHHVLPFFGECTIGYIPNRKILGLSKFPRLVQCVSRKMGLQERLTKEIAEAINTYLEPEGVVVVVEAGHSCMCFRGIKAFNSKTQTIYTMGSLKQKDNLDKFFQMKKD